MITFGTEPATRVDQAQGTARSETASRDEADRALLGVRAVLARRLATSRARKLMAFSAIAATCLASAAMTFVVVALLLARESPSWWRTVDPENPRVVELAERVEQAVVSSMHRARPIGEPWTVAVTAPQANAWLNVKLPRWVRSRNAQWPDQIGQVQTHFGDGRISVGVRIGSATEDQIIAATVNPRLETSGELWLTQPSTNAGRLDIPAGWTIARLQSWLPPEIRERDMTARVLNALRQRGPALPSTYVDLEDGRRIRLLDVRIERDRLLLTCVTEMPHRPVAAGD